MSAAAKTGEQMPTQHEGHQGPAFTAACYCGEACDESVGGFDGDFCSERCRADYHAELRAERNADCDRDEGRL